MPWGGGIVRIPYALSVSNQGALSASVSNQGALQLTIYNPKTDETLQAGGTNVADITAYKDDYGYDLMFTITDVDGNALNLTGGTVTFQMAKEDASSLKVDTACTLVVASDGTCAYTTQSGDFDTVGDYKAQLSIAIASKVYTITGMDVFVQNQFPNI